MIFAVSSAAAAFRSTQNTCAPSRAKVTAVALPLPQPGPIEPAPTTRAVLFLRRSGMGHLRVMKSKSLLPPPLWGRAGEGGYERLRRRGSTPLPNPPPQGGREQQVMGPG